MFIYRRFIALSMAIALLLVPTTTISAENQASSNSREYISIVSDILASAIHDPNIELPKKDQYALSSKIPAYRVLNNSIVPFEDAEYYIVYCD